MSRKKCRTNYKKSSKPTPEQIAQRRAFDEAMNREFRNTQVFCRLDMEKIIQVSGFNVRRFAHWVVVRSKKVTKELADWLKRHFGTYGKLRQNRHFV